MFPVPAVDLATMASLMWWLTLLVTAAAAVWFASVLWKRRGFESRIPNPESRQASDEGVRSV
jgi:hypothetical protein